MESVSQITWRAQAQAEFLSKLVTTKKIQHPAKIGNIATSKLAIGKKVSWWLPQRSLVAML
jgi:hypothetical protein